MTTWALRFFPRLCLLGRGAPDWAASANSISSRGMERLECSDHVMFSVYCEYCANNVYCYVLSKHPSPEKGYTSKSGFNNFTKAMFWTNSNWFRIWCWLIQNYPKLLRYSLKRRILCFFQWSPLCIFAEIQVTNWWNLVSCFTQFYPILLSRIRCLCKYLKSFG